MDKPRRVETTPETGYPTLSEFAGNRRSFLKRLTLGGIGLGLGCGLLARCELSTGGKQAADAYAADTQDWGGAVASPEDGWTPEGSPDSGSADAGKAPDAGSPQPDTGSTPYEPEEPFGGGAPEEQLFDVRLPATGFTTLYIKDNGYLTYAVALKTYDNGLYQFLSVNQDKGIEATNSVLSGYSCEQVDPDGDLTGAEDALRAALATLYAQEVGYEGYWIETIELRVESCDVEEPLDGDVADPEYP